VTGNSALLSTLPSLVLGEHLNALSLSQTTDAVDPVVGDDIGAQHVFALSNLSHPARLGWSALHSGMSLRDQR
jgi:hypothetical protein